MTPELIERLKAKNPDDKLEDLCEELVQMVQDSRKFMSRSYEEWDRNLAVYKSEQWEDADDVRSRQRREPVKQIIPLSYAQVETAVTFLVALFTQNPSVYELTPTGDEDFAIRDMSQRVLDRELRKNNFTLVLAQFLRDVFRMNLGVIRTVWEEETIEIDPPEELALFSLLGDALAPDSAPLEVTIKEGSKIYNISPYNWFPDTRLPLSRWREGQFCADETVYHRSQLESWEDQEQAAGVEWVEEFTVESWKQRSSTRLDGLDPNSRIGRSEKDFMVCVTTIEAKIVPSEYELGESKKTELWRFKVANDQRVIFAEKVQDAAMGFTWDAAQMMSDQHGDLSDSLSSVIDKLQETVSWLINTRVRAVQKHIEGQLVIHPGAVEQEDLVTGKKFIRLKKSAPMGLGVEKFIQQLRTNDPTATHIADAQALMQLMQMVSGVNENAMGQFHTGRRSAAEARNVAGGATARMKLIGQTIWDSGLAPLGVKLLLNARQKMTQDTFLAICGDNDEAWEVFEQFHRDNWWELVNSEDFFVFDATSATEKGYLAQSLQELTVALIGNPQLAVTMGLDIGKMVKEIQSLRGERNLNRFDLDASTQQQQRLELAAQQGAIAPAATSGAGLPQVSAA